LKSRFRRPGREAWLLLYYIVYIGAFILAEKLITTGYWVSWCPLDDRIPFVKEFVLVYVLWYPLMVGMTFYLLFTDRRAFVRYAAAVIAGLSASVIIFFIFPSGQEMRPASLPGNDLCSALLRGIYAADTNTNVLPSMHVVGTLAAMAAAWDAPSVSHPVRWSILALGVLINLSTVLVKQHSVLDIFAGVILFLPIWLLVYRRCPGDSVS